MEIYDIINPQIFPADTKTSQRRPKNVLFWSQRHLRLVSNGIRDDLFLRRCEDVFQETS